MTLSLSFRTDDPTRWGPGLGRRKTKVEGDLDFWAILQAIIELQNSRPQPDNIVAVRATDVGTAFWLILASGTELGPIPIPVPTMGWRGDYVAATVYDVLDIFTVPGVGLFLTEIAHTTPSVFDPGLLIDGAPVYREIIGIGKMPGATYSTPAEAGTVTAAFAERLNVAVPAGPLDVLALVLPPTPNDGDEYEFWTREAIGALTPAAPGTETVRGGSFAMRANSGARWVYRLSDTTWSADVPDPSRTVHGAAAVALDGSNPTSFAHGLTTCQAVSLQLMGSAAPGLGTTTLTAVINGANIDVYAWKPTSATNPTLIASTGTESFTWTAHGI